MRFTTTTCPRCDSPVNGITCPRCGLNVEAASVVTCADCGDTVLEDNAIEHTYQKPISAAYRTEYYCMGCVDERS